MARIGRIGAFIVGDCLRCCTPNPLFNYGSVIGLLLLVFSIFFFVIGWVFDMKCEVKRKNWIGVAILLIAAVLFLYSFLN